MIARTLAALAVAACLVAGCEPQDIVVAEVTSPASEGGASACVDSAGCAPGMFCDRASCDAATGVCKPVPLACDGRLGEVCGCDGVTYFNDCLRLQRGVAPRAPGRCFESAQRCKPGDCQQPGTACALLTPPSAACDMRIPGTCWALPPTCAADAPGPPIEPCDQPGMCVDICSAIRSEKPHTLHGPSCSRPDRH